MNKALKQNILQKRISNHQFSDPKLDHNVILQQDNEPTFAFRPEWQRNITITILKRPSKYLDLHTFKMQEYGLESLTQHPQLFTILTY